MRRGRGKKELTWEVENNGERELKSVNETKVKIVEALKDF